MGINLFHDRVLRVLHGRRMRPSEIAADLGTTTARVSVALEKLKCNRRVRIVGWHTSSNGKVTPRWALGEGADAQRSRATRVENAPLLRSLL